MTTDGLTIQQLCSSLCGLMHGSDRPSAAGSSDSGPILDPDWLMDNEWPALIGWSASVSPIIGGCYSIKISRLEEIYQMLLGLDASMHFSDKIIIQEAITKQYHKEINLKEQIFC